MSSMTTSRYPPLARVLHWISAAVIIWAMVTGIYMAVWAGPETKSLISFINISVTTLLVPVFAVRIGYRLLGPRPPPLNVPRRERNLAALGHGLLYGLTTVVLLSGLLMMDKDIAVFDWLTIPQPLENPLLNRVFFDLHRVSSSLLGLMIIGHVAAVIRHQRRGTQVLRRMTFPATATARPRTRQYKPC